MIASDEEVDAFLEHHGVKGMHWGVRGTKRVQKRLDRAQRIVEGKGSLKDNLLRSAITKKGVARQLQRGANNQAKIRAGKLKVTNAMATVSGVKIKDLKYKQKGDANAKLDNGQKAALAYLGVVGAVTLASAASR